MRAFLDASAWVALADVRDIRAERMRRIMSELRLQRAQFATTTWTLYEALAVTQRGGKGLSIDLHRRALRIARVERVPFEIERQALRRFLDWTDKWASVVDHANILVAQRLSCDAVVSFDADFVPLAGGAGIELLR
ncbi:MAG TPA: PIN domain-containing protein [Tepidiformaceae bacterium]|nr:PIN domain-containing protein [Tepidiformaceae bacterium]